MSKEVEVLQKFIELEVTAMSENLVTLNVPDGFDKTEELFSNLQIVWIDGRCGIYNKTTGKQILDAICSKILKMNFPECFLIKAENNQQGIFNILSGQIKWN